MLKCKESHKYYEKYGILLWKKPGDYLQFGASKGLWFMSLCEVGGGRYLKSDRKSYLSSGMGVVYNPGGIASTDVWDVHILCISTGLGSAEVSL